MEIWDGVADQYDQFYSSRSFQKENNKIREMIPIPRPIRDSKSHRIIDVGCGTGLFLDLYPWINPNRYIGIDPSQPMIDQAKAKYPRHVFVNQAVEDLNYQPVFGDLVISLFSMNYFKDDFDIKKFIGDASFFGIVYLPHRFKYETMILGEEKMIQFWTLKELEQFGSVKPWRFDGHYRVPKLNDLLARMFPNKASYGVITK